jgi:hypothetical protein
MTGREVRAAIMAFRDEMALTAQRAIAWDSPEALLASRVVMALNEILEPSQVGDNVRSQALTVQDIYSGLMPEPDPRRTAQNYIAPE